MTEEFENNFMAFAEAEEEARLLEGIEARMAKEKAPQEPTEGATPNVTTSTTPPLNITPNKGVMDKAGDVAADVGRGIINAPRRIERGITGAAAQFMEVGKDINRVFDSPVLQLINEKGEFDISLMSQSEIDKKFGGDAPGVEKIFESLQLDKPLKETVTGQMVESVTQFLVGFKGVDKVAKVIAGGDKAIKAGKAAKAAITAGKGAVADMAVFDEQEQRLSNLVESVPALQNPITEYLESGEDDSFAESKLKQGIEGLGLGLVAESLVPAIKAMKGLRRARNEVKVMENEVELTSQPLEEAAGVGLEVKGNTFLGDASSEDLIKKKIKASGKQTKDIKPDEIGKGVVTPREYEINFARIEGPEDIKKIMDEFVNRPDLKKSIEDARRGVRSAEQTLTAATDIDGFNTMMSRRQGDALNAEQITAARRVYYDTTEKLMEAAKLAASPEASVIDQYNFRKMVAVHHAVQKEFMGVRAEAGRALQAWRIPVGKTGAENLRQVEDMINQFGGIEASSDLARRLSSLGNNLNTDQINMITQKAGEARTLDAITEAWTLGLLTNPVTHVVNLGSNILTGVTLGGERAIASAGKGPIKIEESAAFFSGLLQSQKEAIKNAAIAFRTGETGIGLGKIELPRTRTTSREVLDPQGAYKVPGALIDYYGKMVSYAGNALAAGDEYSKTMIYRAQLKALATRQGIAKGLDGIELRKFVAETADNPSNAMRADAVQFANYGTFTKELGRTGQNVQRTIAHHPWLRFVAPFVRTPVNIFKFTFERTPLALANSKIRDDIAAGGLRKQMALSKLGMGSSVMWIGTDMALNGKITGAGPADSRQRAALRRTGWQPYSVKIGDTYYSYSRFEPVATILGLSADLSEIMSNYESYDMKSQEEVDELAAAAVIAIGNQVVGKTFLSGFADLTEVLSDPKRYADGFLNRFAGSFVPAVSAAIERAADPELEAVFNMMDAVKSRIPGLSNQVPNRLNVYGEEIKTFYPNEESVAGATAQRIASLFNPVYYSSEKADSDLDRFMIKNGFSIDMPSKTQAFEGVRVDLREYPEIYSRLVRLRGGKDLDSTLISIKYGGETMKDYLTNLVKDETLGSMKFFTFSMDAEEQQQYISNVVSDYQAEAKKQLMLEYPVIQMIIDEEKVKQSNLPAESNLERTKPIP